MRTTKMHEEEEERKLRLRRQARSAAKSGDGRHTTVGRGWRELRRPSPSFHVDRDAAHQTGVSAFHSPPQSVVGVHSGIT